MNWVWELIKEQKVEDEHRQQVVLPPVIKPCFGSTPTHTVPWCTCKISYLKMQFSDEKGEGFEGKARHPVKGSM